MFERCSPKSRAARLASTLEFHYELVDQTETIAVLLPEVLLARLRCLSLPVLGAECHGLLHFAHRSFGKVLGSNSDSAPLFFLFRGGHSTVITPNPVQSKLRMITISEALPRNDLLAGVDGRLEGIGGAHFADHMVSNTEAIQMRCFSLTSNSAKHFTCSIAPRPLTKGATCAQRPRIILLMGRKRQTSPGRRR
jgi:hypothetical protein